MKKRILWVMLILVVVCGAAGYYLANGPVPGQQGRQSPAQMLAATQLPGMTIPEVPPASQTTESPTTAAAGENRNEGKDDVSKMFQVDERGALVLNEKTRLNIESLTALNTPEELAAKLRKLSAVLPPQAYKQLAHLIDQFERYTTASKDIYPPDVAPSTIDQAVTELQGLHSLRVTYFGHDVASAFFSEEEKQGRQLLELMRKENENMTMDERAHRAQMQLKPAPK